MECLFLPELTEISGNYSVTGDEFKHIKALRLREGDYICGSNGKGFLAEMQLTQMFNDYAKIRLCRIHKNTGEIGCKLALAIGIISDRNRFEFAIEKAVELGVTDIYPLLTDYVEKKTISSERLNSKVIAALKQSKRSLLTKISQPIKIYDIIEYLSVYQNVILADSEGIFPDSLKITGNTIIFIGPEGGFSKQEQDFLNFEQKAILLNLGNRRLRSETAAITALSVISMKLTK